jgi:hypothetical protein
MVKFNKSLHFITVEEWSNGDRFVCILLSLFGPISLFIATLDNLQKYISEKFKNYWEKPAKW